MYLVIGRVLFTFEIHSVTYTVVNPNYRYAWLCLYFKGLTLNIYGLHIVSDVLLTKAILCLIKKILILITTGELNCCGGGWLLRGFRVRRQL